MSASVRLKALIKEALATISANGALPQNAVLYIWDPVLNAWDPYATGRTTQWFCQVIDNDGIVEIYTRARLVGCHGTVLVDFSW